MVNTVLKPALGIIRVPLKVDGLKVLFNMNILWPHLLFSKLYSTKKVSFMRHMCGGASENIGTFWRAQTDHPSFPDHPMHSHPEFDFRARAIPLSMHGDGTNVISIGKKSAKHMDTLSWSGLLDKSNKAASVNDCIVFVFQLSQLAEITRNTMDEIWSCICWSCTWLYRGRHPDRDWRGRMFDESDGEWLLNRLKLLADVFV